MLLCFQMGKKVKPLKKYHIFLPVVQTLFYTELAGILMDSNNEVNKHTFKNVCLDTLCIK